MLWQLHENTKTHSPSTQHPNSLLLFYLRQSQMPGAQGQRKTEVYYGKNVEKERTRKNIFLYLSSLRKRKLPEIHRKTTI